ncbi:MAG: MFS transporter [Bacillota bacterium]
MKRIIVPVLSLSAIMFVIMTGSSAISPILPNYAHKFGVSLTVVGFVLAMNSSMRMLVGFPAGVLADRWGRKPFVPIGMSVTATGALVSWSATGVEMLFLGQALVGIGAALYATAALSMVIDMADETNRGKATGLYMMGYHLGALFGPGIGGWLAYRYGLNSPFMMFGVLAAAAAGTSLVLTRETRPARSGPITPKPAANPGVSWKHVLTKNLGVVYFVNFAFRFGFNGLLWTILPVMIEEQLGLDSRVTGLVFMMVGGLTMLLFFPSGFLADRFGRRNVMLPGAVVAAGGFFLFRWADTVPLIIIASILLSIGGGFVSTIPAALVGDFAPDEVRGTAMGFYRSFGDLGLVVAPIVLGFTGDYFGLPATFIVTCALWVAATLTMLWLPKPAPAMGAGRSGKAERV